VSLINREARQNTAKRLLKKRQPQQRSRWTEVEVERLVELIENYGVSWAYLLAMDDEHPEGAVLQQRDQVSLKDKARNMKMDFLKYVFLSTVIDIRMLTNRVELVLSCPIISRALLLATGSSGRSRTRALCIM
jgi:hypothetical protein